MRGRASLRFWRRESALPTRFGEVPAVAGDFPTWLRRAARWAPRRQLVESVPFLIDAEHLGEPAFAALGDLLAGALARISAADLAAIPVEDRARAWLAATGRRTALADFVVERAHHNGNVATAIEFGPDRARLLADFAEVHPEGLPTNLREIGAEHSPLELRIRRCAPAADGVELELFAVVRAIDFAAHPPRIAVRRLGVELAHVPAPDAAATRFTARWFQSHDDGAITLRLPDLTAPVQVTLTFGDGHSDHTLIREATLTMDRVSARLPQPPRGQRIATDLRVVGDEIVLDGVDVRLPLTEEVWGQPRRPRPAGPARIHPPVEPSAALAARLPLELTTPDHRVEVDLQDGELRIRLAAPLTDDERGPRRQFLLREAIRTTPPPLDPHLVLFSSYAGTRVTDSPLAIHHELRRRRPDLRAVWAVADRSVAPPEGADAVLVRSREWYDAWSRAHLVVTNVEPDRWFSLREGQRLVQTFHGYPSKTMGKVLWESKNFSPRKIRYQLEHTSATWSLLVTPEEAMDRHYREQYDWTGPIVHEGYPRNDALIGRAADERRAQVRELLGIGDRTAVLHAPTWRDDQATDFRAAAAVEHLDAAAFADQLGDEQVLLWRGHRFHRPSAGGRAVIDVTDHPEINDLILAADVAVLDYSSLRFDFAITGKPMIFLVPDLESYAGNARGFLYPFEESAPGPLVADTAAVLAELRDLDGLVRRHRGELGAFNMRFNRHHDGLAARRVVDAIQSLVADS